MTKARLFFSIVAFLLAGTGCGQASVKQPDKQVCDATGASAFVDGFYARYLSAQRADNFRLDQAQSLQVVGGLLSHRLLQALRDDIAAQSASTDEIVGLDFDPFLYSQDPRGVYRRLSTGCDGGRNFVTVAIDGQKIVVKLDRPAGGRVEISDIVYPNRHSLLGELRMLRNARTHPVGR
jgi:hypothetical protein